MAFLILLIFFVVIIYTEENDESKNNYRNLDSNGYSNIRIHIDYSCFSVISSENTSENQLIINAISKAKTTLEKLIKVEPLEKGINLLNYQNVINFGCSYNLNLVVPADLIIFIKDFISTSEKVDFATSKIIKYIDDDVKKRPIIGLVEVYFVPDTLTDYDSKLQAWSTMFLHEFTHILGFNKKIFTLKGLINTTQIESRMNNRKPSKEFFIGPKAVKMAQNYFNCKNLPGNGIELDNINGQELKDGNSIHWSGRILMGDYMIAEIYYIEQAISEITLASLEDLGYYEVNYYTGGLMRFGKNKGCDFFELDCVEYSKEDPIGIKTTFPNEFCSQVYQDIDQVFGTCSPGRQSMAFCFNSKGYSEIYNNFADYRRDSLDRTSLGFDYEGSGFSPKKIIEFCPYCNSDIKTGDPIYDYDGYCKFGNSKYGNVLSFLNKMNYTTISNYIEEEYSEESFCVFSSILNENKNNPTNVKGILRPTCYKMFCSEKSITIKIGNNYFVCPRQGGTIKIESSNTNNHTGYLICPDYNLICTGTKLCNNLFDCVANKSLYKSSTFTYDYPNPSDNISIELQTNNASLISYISENISELADDGMCPKNCKQCLLNRQCIDCESPFIYYVGKHEGDNEQINCTRTPPKYGYYNISKEGKTYFYKCKENCKVCYNYSICHQCFPTHYLNKTTYDCVERIPGCLNYNESYVLYKEDNNYGESYTMCKDCNNPDNYYCFDFKKDTCIKKPDINLSLYYDLEDKSYPCYKKCEEAFINCLSCQRNTCTVCNQSKHYINNHGNCLKEIEHCNTYNKDSHEPECAICEEDENYYCIENNRTHCSYIAPDIFSSYFKMNNINPCVKLCTEEFGNLCLECNYSKCAKCKEGYYPLDISRGKCLENIPNCKKHILNVESRLCDYCNETGNYYCLKEGENEDRTKCSYIAPEIISSYFKISNNENACVKLCKKEYEDLCLECNYLECTKCEEGYYPLDIKKGKCLEKIPNCKRHNLNVESRLCDYCNETGNYYCIKEGTNEDRTQCSYIAPQNISSYFKIDNNENSCVQLCSEKYPLCLECNYTHCIKCQEGYFIYNGNCFKNITGCIDNKIINPETEQKACDECNRDRDYYCINEDKSKCHYLNETSISEYYELPSLDYSCYKHCDNITKYCIKCDSTQCFKCSSQYALSRKTKQCLTPPNSFLENVKCNITTHYLNTTLDSKLNFAQMVKDYFYDLNHISKVEHYVGVNYTMTFYMNSNCTNGLLPQGYYKLDTRELNKTFVDESDLDLVFHLLGIYINNNYQSHLRFYSPEDQKWMDPINNCNTCLDKNYIVTNNLYNILNDTIGTQFTEFILEKNIDIFEENSEIYTDTCNNLTLYEIDIPINLRKNYLFLHEYLEPLLCHDIACEFSELNMTAKTSTCLCKMGNEFSEIFEPIDFNFVPYKSTEKTKGFSEAIKVIKCMLKGIKYSHFKINLAAIIILAAFIIQIICYIAYGCFGKPLVNIKDLPNVANPPKAEDDTNRIYLFADWNMNLPGEEKNETQQAPNEREIIIQPRDDSGEEIVSEEKSFTNDFFSNISIDTNAGGSLFPNKRLNRNLKALEKKKKVLILLGNKGKKKLSVEQSSINNEHEIISENDDMPLSRRRKDDKSGLLRNYWIFLSIKQHIINYFADIKCCKMTESYIPLSLRFIRSLFLVVLSIILSILWLDPIYFEKKWNHFNEKYSISNSPNTNIEIPLSERVSYASSKGFGYTVVNLIVLIFADFIIGILFFSLRAEIENILSRGKMSKLQDIILKARRNYNIFYVINFILIIIFFLSLCGFGVTYPGGIVDCLTITFLALLLFEIIPFIWSLILALFRYFGYKKKSSCMIDFSEFFLF